MLLTVKTKGVGSQLDVGKWGRGRTHSSGLGSGWCCSLRQEFQVYRADGENVSGHSESEVPVRHCGVIPTGPLGTAV